MVVSVQCEKGKDEGIMEILTRLLGKLESILRESDFYTEGLTDNGKAEISPIGQRIASMEAGWGRGTRYLPCIRLTLVQSLAPHMVFSALSGVIPGLRVRNKQ